CEQCKATVYVNPSAVKPLVKCPACGQNWGMPATAPSVPVVPPIPRRLQPAPGTRLAPRRQDTAPLPPPLPPPLPLPPTDASSPPTPMSSASSSSTASRSSSLPPPNDTAGRTSLACCTSTRSATWPCWPSTHA